MGTRRSQPSFLKRFEQLERQARLERIRRKGHTSDPTWIVGGMPIAVGLILPLKRVGIDSDGETPEWKRLIAINGFLDAGTATIGWQLNGTPLAETISISTSDTDDVYLATPIDLAHGDKLRPVINAASGDAYGLSATAFIVTAAR